jgi:hypothetical protein
MIVSFIHDRLISSIAFWSDLVWFSRLRTKYDAGRGAFGAAVQGIVANDPSTGRRVLLNYDSPMKTVGSIVGVFDFKTGTWIRLADAKPSDGGLNLAQLDQLARLSVDRFAAVSVRPWRAPLMKVFSSEVDMSSREEST